MKHYKKSDKFLSYFNLQINLLRDFDYDVALQLKETYLKYGINKVLKNLNDQINNEKTTIPAKLTFLSFTGDLQKIGNKTSNIAI